MTTPEAAIMSADEDRTSHDRWVRLEVIFHAAVRLPARRRASFLRMASESDPTLTHDVEVLRRANDAAHGRLRRIVTGAVEALAGRSGRERR